MTGLKGRSCEEQLKALVLLVWRRGTPIAIYSFLRRPGGDRGGISSACYPGVQGVGMLESCSRGTSDWTVGSISLLGGWSTTAVGFLEM